MPGFSAPCGLSTLLNWLFSVVATVEAALHETCSAHENNGQDDRHLSQRPFREALIGLNAAALETTHGENPPK